jgi:hypothetical protein
MRAVARSQMQRASRPLTSPSVVSLLQAHVFRLTYRTWPLILPGQFLSKLPNLLAVTLILLVTLCSYRLHRLLSFAFSPTTEYDYIKKYHVISKHLYPPSPYFLHNSSWRIIGVPEIYYNAIHTCWDCNQISCDTGCASNISDWRSKVAIYAIIVGSQQTFLPSYLLSTR